MIETSRPSARVLARLRRYGAVGVWLFVALLVVASAERRMSELHFDLRSAAPCVENNEALDGDEIRLRLIGAKDERLPDLPRTPAAACGGAIPAVTEPAQAGSLGPAPRGPPLRPSSAA